MLTISHELSPFLDVHPPMNGQYRLEVSSPGIERKLVKPVHFQNAVGEKIKLKLGAGDKLKGLLKSADDKGIVVEKPSRVMNHFLMENSIRLKRILTGIKF